MVDEEVQHLLVEVRNVRGLAAGDPVAVAHYLLVCPEGSGLAKIVLDGVVAGHVASLDQMSGDQQPATVADDGDGAASLVDVADKLQRQRLFAQGLDVLRSSRESEARRNCSGSASARVSSTLTFLGFGTVMDGLDFSGVGGDDNGLSSLLIECLAGLDEFSFFKEIGG